MLKEEIGFIHGVPENPDRTWEKEINGKTFTFVKRREGKSGVIFLYNCSHRTGDSASSTGFHSDRNLMPDEVENLPQFANFIAGITRA